MNNNTNRTSLFNRIKNYSDFCKEFKIKEFKESDFLFLPKLQRIKAFNYHKIQNIVQFLNGKWRIDWTNSNQQKRYPYFIYNTGSGLGVYCSGVSCDCYFGQVAYFKDKETSDFVGKTFLDIYIELSK